MDVVYMYSNHPTIILCVIVIAHLRTYAISSTAAFPFNFQCQLFTVNSVVLLFLSIKGS